MFYYFCPSFFLLLSLFPITAAIQLKNVPDTVVQGDTVEVEWSLDLGDPSSFGLMLLSLQNERFLSLTPAILAESLLPGQASPGKTTITFDEAGQMLLIPIEERTGIFGISPGTVFSVVSSIISRANGNPTQIAPGRQITVLPKSSNPPVSGTATSLPGPDTSTLSTSTPNSPISPSLSSSVDPSPSSSPPSSEVPPQSPQNGSNFGDANGVSLDLTQDFPTSSSDPPSVIAAIASQTTDSGTETGNIAASPTLAFLSESEPASITQETSTTASSFPNASSTSSSSSSPDNPTSTSSESSNNSNAKQKTIGIVVGVVLGVVALLLFAGILSYRKRKRIKGMWYNRRFSDTSFGQDPESSYAHLAPPPYAFADGISSEDVHHVSGSPVARVPTMRSIRSQSSESMDMYLTNEHLPAKS